MEERWYFPPNLGGDEEGFNHAGMVHFKADPHRYTARETIQNVLDAKDPNKKGQPTVVKFRLFKVPTKDAIPELGIFKEIIKECNPKLVTYLSATSVYGNHQGEWVNELSKTNIKSAKAGRLKIDRQFIGGKEKIRTNLSPARDG